MAYGAVPARTAIIETWCATTSCSSRAMAARSRASTSRSLTAPRPRGRGGLRSTAACRRARSAPPRPRPRPRPAPRPASRPTGVAPGTPGRGEHDQLGGQERRRPRRGGSASAGRRPARCSQPTMAGTGQTAARRYMKTALAVSRTVMAAAGIPAEQRRPGWWRPAPPAAAREPSGENCCGSAISAVTASSTATMTGPRRAPEVGRQRRSAPVPPARPARTCGKPR